MNIIMIDGKQLTQKVRVKRQYNYISTTTTTSLADWKKW